MKLGQVVAVVVHVRLVIFLVKKLAIVMQAKVRLFNSPKKKNIKIKREAKQNKHQIKQNGNAFYNFIFEIIKSSFMFAFICVKNIPKQSSPRLVRASLAPI